MSGTNKLSSKPELVVPLQEISTIFPVVDQTQPEPANQDRQIVLPNLRKCIMLSAYSTKASLVLTSAASAVTTVVPDSILSGGVTAAIALGLFTLPRIGLYRLLITVLGDTPVGMSSSLAVEVAVHKQSDDTKVDSFIWNSPAATVTKAPDFTVGLFYQAASPDEQCYVSVRQYSGVSYTLLKINTDISLVAIGTPA